MMYIARELKPTETTEKEEEKKQQHASENEVRVAWLRIMYMQRDKRQQKHNVHAT
jgi:hypothetical protein